jgi:hypothetical protein
MTSQPARKQPRIEVETNKRSYTVIGSGRVTWEKGEKVIRIEAAADDR